MEQQLGAQQFNQGNMEISHGANEFQIGAQTGGYGRGGFRGQGMGGIGGQGQFGYQGY